jgi:4a-hydroxytetrahydrobiopterin dehydratase|tara:strand:- start:1562 stop:1909 length:348 start_codon:yes stop_codon:yes gene_type:complete
LLKLFEKKCNNCEKDALGLNKSEISHYISKINQQWKLNHNGKKISRRFNFPIYSKTIAFVNAVAWIATQEGHHPLMRMGYGYCDVTYTTTSIDALTENDFICAAKIDYIMKGEVS